MADGRARLWPRMTLCNDISTSQSHRISHCTFCNDFDFPEPQIVALDVQAAHLRWSWHRKLTDGRLQLAWKYDTTWSQLSRCLRRHIRTDIRKTFHGHLRGLLAPAEQTSCHSCSLQETDKKSQRRPLRRSAGITRRQLLEDLRARVCLCTLRQHWTTYTNPNDMIIREGCFHIEFDSILVAIKNWKPGGGDSM